MDAFENFEQKAILPCTTKSHIQVLRLSVDTAEAVEECSLESPIIAHGRLWEKHPSDADINCACQPLHWEVRAWGGNCVRSDSLMTEEWSASKKFTLILLYSMFPMKNLTRIVRFASDALLAKIIPLARKGRY